MEFDECRSAEVKCPGCRWRGRVREAIAAVESVEVHDYSCPCCNRIVATFAAALLADGRRKMHALTDVVRAQLRRAEAAQPGSNAIVKRASELPCLEPKRSNSSGIRKPRTRRPRS